MNVKIKCDLNLKQKQKQKQKKNPEGLADLSSTVCKKANWTVSRYLWRLYCVPGSGYVGCCLFSVHILMERWWIKSKQTNKTHLIGIFACSFYEFFHFPTERTYLSPQVCGFPCRKETLLSQGSGTSSVFPLISMQLLFGHSCYWEKWTRQQEPSELLSWEYLHLDQQRPLRGTALSQSWKLLERTVPQLLGPAAEASWDCLQ